LINITVGLLVGYANERTLKMAPEELEKALNRCINDAWIGKTVRCDHFLALWRQISITKGIPIFDQKSIKDNKDLIYMWAPAGNQSNNSKIVFSGFSTSINAAKDITTNITKALSKTESNGDISGKLREICSRAIYKGLMLRRFAWGINKIVPLLSDILSYPIFDIINKEWTNLLDLSESIEKNENNNIKTGQGSLFCGDINCETVLTQATFNGLAVKEEGRYSCLANKIPMDIAVEMSKKYILGYIDNGSGNKPRIIFILGKNSAYCWNKYIQDSRKDRNINQSIQIFTYNWWKGKRIFNTDATQYILPIPHPSPGNPTYENAINDISSYLEN